MTSHAKASGQTSLRGVIPIVITPFLDEGHIDEASLRAEIRWTASVGVHGLGIALASEVPRLSVEERTRVAQIVVEETAGELPLVIHAGSEAARLSIDLARKAEAVGASAVMLPPPTFEVGAPEGELAFFTEVASETELDLVIQDLPNAPVSANLVNTLAEAFPGRIAVKIERTPTARRVEAMIESTQAAVPVFGGAGGLQFWSELLRGAAGTMPATPLADVFVTVWNKMQSNDLRGARHHFQQFVPLLAVATQPDYVIPMHRELLRLRGVFSSRSARQPSLELSQADLAELHDLYHDCVDRSDSKLPTVA